MRITLPQESQLHNYNLGNEILDKSLDFIKRNTYSLPKNIEVDTYQTLIRPFQEYSSSPRDPYTVSLVNQIAQIQGRAARFCLQ